MHIPLFSLLFGILCAVLAFTATNPRDRVEMIAGAFFFLGGAAAYVPDFVRPNRLGRARGIIETIAICSFFGGMVVILGTLVSAPTTVTTFEFIYRGLHRLVGPYVTTLLCTGALGLTGYGLFLLKLKRLLIYANAEITFALTSCYVAVERSKEGFRAGTVTVLAAATYLVVRGLDNRKKAIETRDERNAVPLPIR